MRFSLYVEKLSFSSFQRRVTFYRKRTIIGAESFQNSYRVATFFRVNAEKLCSYFRRSLLYRSKSQQNRQVGGRCSTSLRNTRAVQRYNILRETKARNLLARSVTTLPKADITYGLHKPGDEFQWLREIKRISHEPVATGRPGLLSSCVLQADTI